MRRDGDAGTKALRSMHLVDKMMEQVSKEHGPFARFYKALLAAQSSQQPVSSAVSGRNAECKPFPMPLPFAANAKINRLRGGRRSQKRCRGKLRAEKLTNFLVSLFGFWECGSPSDPRVVDAIVSETIEQGMSAVSSRFAENLKEEVSEFCRVADVKHEATRGTKNLSEILHALNNINVSELKVCDINKLTCNAMPVQSDRISLPAQAGLVSPSDILKGERKEIFDNMHDLIPNPDFNEPAMRPCHMVPKEEQGPLHQKLLETGMAVLIPTEMAIRDRTGKVIRGGLFTVPHKESSDRLINDRRPQNRAEQRLCWASLPHGTLFTQLIVSPNEDVRGSGDDLSNYFYVLAHNPKWLGRNVISPEPLNGSDFLQFGAKAGQRYYLALRVVAMGDLNAVDIAQATHEQVLKNASCFLKHEILEYGQPVPCLDVETWEGLYIDDHIVIQKVPKSCKTETQGKQELLRDEIIMQSSRAEYLESGLPRAEAKAFDKEPVFVAWGTEVNSHTGRVGTPQSKLVIIGNLVLEALTLKKLTKKSLQSLLGQFIHPYSHRNELMCVFDKAFLFVHRCKENDFVVVPDKVREEFLCAVALLSVAHSCIRWPVSRRLSATDATPTTGGATETMTTKRIAETLYRASVHRGEHIRLDWIDTPSHLLPETAMPQAQEEIEELIMCHRWRASRSFGFRKSAHVNIQELKAARSELKALAIRDPLPGRVINMCDSRVTCGAWAKGRSSSGHLNRVLQSSVGYSICGRKRLFNVWTGTKKNPADYPSRHQEVPKPSPAPDWLVEQCKSLMCRSLPSGLKHLGGPELEEEWLEQGAKDQGKQKPWKEPPSRSTSFCGHHEGVNVSSQGVCCRSTTVERKGSFGLLKKETKYCFSGTPSFKEVFGGKGGLTAQFKRRKGWRTKPPVEAYPNGCYDPFNDVLKDDCFSRLKEEARVARGEHWHYGTPCGSFALINVNLNKGTRTRLRPEGNGSLPREVQGNLFLERSLILIRLLEAGGNTWTLENPRTSFLFRMSKVRRLVFKKSTFSVDFDQCMFDLIISGSPLRVKKATRIIGNIPLDNLGIKCDHSHQHQAAIGSVRTEKGWVRRTQLAGAYPPKLCKALAEAICIAWQ